MPVYVGGVDAAGNPHHWGSVAAASNLSPQALINFNYGTTIPEVVNFYLQRNCGCRELAADGKNLRFIGASPGLIYVPAFNPVERFDLDRLQELKLEVHPHPKTPGNLRMQARFTIRLRLSRKLVDPRLYEYRQMIRGGGYTQLGAWTGTTWGPATTSGPMFMVIPPRPIDGGQFKIPGAPPGLLPHTFKEDGLTHNGLNLHYGHRGDPPPPPGTGRDQYSTDGFSYECEDFPELEIKGADVRVGHLVHLHLDFKGVVVRFDRPPGTPGRKIVEEVAEKNWSFRAVQKVVTLTPLNVQA